MRRRDFIRMAAGAAAASLLSRPDPARAATYPSRPITLMVGFAAGGPLDLVSRILAQGLTSQLDQQIVVENRPGATGSVAAGQVASAAPDGHTLLAIPATYAAAAAFFRKLPYRPVEDFSAIGMTVEFPYALVTHAGHPTRTIADFVSAAQTSSAPLTFGTSGIGSLQHLAMEHFARSAGVKLQHIPFRGGGPAIMELLGKRLDCVLDQPSALTDLIRDGRLRALAVTGSARFFSLPDTPTIAEAGFAGYDVRGWQGLLAPAGLPDRILRRLHEALSAVLAEPEVVSQLRALGNDPRLSSAEDFKARLAAEINTWSEVIAAARIERF